MIIHISMYSIDGNDTLNSGLTINDWFVFTWKSTKNNGLLQIHIMLIHMILTMMEIMILEKNILY